MADQPIAVRAAPTLAAAGEGTHLLAWEDRRSGNLDIYTRLVRQERVIDTRIRYIYDPLNRLTPAFGGLFIEHRVVSNTFFV